MLFIIDNIFSINRGNSTESLSILSFSSTCLNAVWNCRRAYPNEIKEYPRASDSKSKCKASDNFEFTTCEPVEPVTCKNMHSQDFFSASVCHAGCKCKEGYVLDTKSKKCVRPQECPCHHGGKSYKENSTVVNDCNTWYV